LYEVDAVTHRWNVSTFEHLAKCKQLLIDYAVNEGFDYIFFVDSDLLLDPGTLQSLYAAQVDINNACFWTSWQPGAPAQPQCWLTHPYGLEGMGMAEHEYLRALDEHQLVRVAGGGACTLISCKVLDRVQYHPRLPIPQQDGMWQGEDRSFALQASRYHIQQYCDGWPRVHHCYHPNQRTVEDIAASWEQLHAPQQLYAKVGDLVNVTITPLEDVPLQQHLDPRARCVRGRLGGVRMAPEIEVALLDMTVGERRIVDFTVQPGHPVYPAGMKRALQVELVDARPYVYPNF
jgi:hypothetical protein